MANLSPTKAVQKNAVPFILGQANEAIAIGESVYRGTDGKWRLSDADASSTAKCGGIAVSSADGLDDWLAIAPPGAQLDLGDTLTLNVEYCVSNTAGAIMPKSDLSVGEYYTRIGAAISTSVLEVDVYESGVQQT